MNTISTPYHPPTQFTNLEPGDCFRRLDKDNIYMRISYAGNYVDLKTGVVFTMYDLQYEIVRIDDPITLKRI